MMHLNPTQINRLGQINPTLSVARSRRASLLRIVGGTIRTLRRVFLVGGFFHLLPGFDAPFGELLAVVSTFSGSHKAEAAASPLYLAMVKATESPLRHQPCQQGQDWQH